MEIKTIEEASKKLSEILARDIEESRNGDIFFFSDQGNFIFECTSAEGNTVDGFFLLKPCWPRSSECYLRTSKDISFPNPNGDTRWDCGCKCVSIAFPDRLVGKPQSEDEEDKLEKMTEELMQRAVCVMKRMLDAESLEKVS